MAFLEAQEVSTEVRCFLWPWTSEPSEAWSITCRGPGRGTKEEGPPWAPTGLNGACAPPVPSGGALPDCPAPR